MRQVKPFHKNKNWPYLFNRSIFNHSFIEHRYIFWVKADFAVLWAFHYAIKFVFFMIYNLLILYFYIFQYFLKFSSCNIWSFCVCHRCFQCEYFPIKLSDIPLKALTIRWYNVNKTICRRCPTLFQHYFNVGLRSCINIEQVWKSNFGFSFAFNVGSILFQFWSTVLKQRWSNFEMLAE